MMVGVQRHAPADLPPGKTRCTLYRGLRGPQGGSGRVRKISSPIGIRFPDRPVRSESLYRLSYARPHRESGCYINDNISFVFWKSRITFSSTEVCQILRPFPVDRSYSSYNIPKSLVRCQQMLVFEKKSDATELLIMDPGYCSDCVKV
jgi:hypothetical protein